MVEIYELAMSGFWPFIGCMLFTGLLSSAFVRACFAVSTLLRGYRP